MGLLLLSNIDSYACNNLVTNNEFNSGSSPWNYYNNSGASGFFTLDNSSQLSGVNSGRINITNSTGNIWHLGMYQSNLSIQTGKLYEVSFMAKASYNKTIGVTFQDINNGWSSFQYSEFGLTTSTQTITYYFTSNVTTTNSTINFLLGLNNATTWIDNVVVREVCPSPMQNWNFTCTDGKSVDLLGFGRQCQANTTINISNTGNINNIYVEAVYKDNNPGSSITFRDAANNPYVAPRISLSFSNSVWVYRAVIPATSVITYTDNTHNCNLQSVVAYVHRNSSGNTQSTGVYTDISGYNNIRTFSVPIPTATTARNITMKVPISELTNDGRYLKMTATAGTVTNTTFIYGPDASLGSCCLNIVNVILNNVPANINAVTVEIDTRGYQNGQSVSGQSYVVAAAVNAEAICICPNPPSAPSTTGASRCGPGSLTLTAAGCAGGTIRWYDSPSGGTILGTGSSFTTPSLSSTTTYYASCFQSDCESTRIAAIATIQNISPNISGNLNVCVGNTTTTLTASGGGTYLWSTGATSAAITVSPSVTTAYTVTVTNSGCSATATATVDVAPTCCSGQVSSGVIAKYDFSEGTGAVVNDISGNGTPLNLTIQNPANTTWVAGCGLRINTATRISSSGNATKIRTALQATNAMTVEAWVQAANTTQNGPARIVSMSSDVSNRNFLMGQGSGGAGTIWAQRTRHSAAWDSNGLPERVTTANTATTNLTHLVFTRDASGVERFYINGVQNGTWTLAGNFSNWSEFALHLGNEQSNDRTWLGTLYGVTIYNQALNGTQVTQNFNAGSKGNCSNCPPPSCTTLPSPPTAVNGERCGTGTITLTAGGCSGGTIHWYSSPSSQVSLGTGTSFTTPSLSATTVYYVGCTVGVCASETRTAVSAVINALPTISITGANSTICSGGTVAMTTSVSGGFGSVTYQWQSSPNGTTWTNISGATSSSYTTPALTVTTHYRVLATYSGTGCGTATSNTRIVTVVADPSVTTHPVGATICSGGVLTMSVAATGGTPGLTYQWQSSPNGTTWTNISGATGTSYTTPALTSTTHYRVLVDASGVGCGQAVSNVAIVTVVAQHTVSVSAGVTICTGGTATVSSVVSGGTGTITYQWQSSPDGATWTNISGATSASYTTPVLTTTTRYRVIATRSGNNCGSVTSGANIVTVTPNNTVTSNAARTLCINSALSPAITHTTTGATGIGTATGLPAGVTAAWASNTITISGTPTAAGTFNYTIPLTGGCGTVNATGTIIVTPNRTVTSNAARTLCINSALSPAITHTTTGATGIGTATGLPAGVTASWASNTITISGTPTAAGTFNYTIPLTGGCGTANATGTIIVNINTVSSTTTRTLCINTALSPTITRTTTGATGIGTATGLPAGVTAAWASNTITISGTPTAAGTFNYTIPLTGGCGTVNATGTIIVTPNRTVTSNAARTLCINTALSPAITHTTTGATGIGTATGLPAGVTATWASNTITISGTPTAAGTFNYTIPLTGGCGTANATGQIIVTPNRTVTSNAARTLCINSALSPAITHTTTGATGIGTATGLPAGVTAAWASNTITISGTPTAAGTFNYTIPLTGGCGTVNATGTIIVTPNRTVTSNAARTLCINSALSPAITHTTTGATGIGTTTGLPAGVTAAWASNTITISGTPTAAGTFNYTIPLTGGCGTANATGTIIVNINTVSSTTTRTLCINTALSPTITRTTTGATGIGTATGLPAGVTAAWASNTITISGTPTAAGTFNYTIPLTGGCGTVNATGTIIVTPNRTVTSNAARTLCINSALSPAITHTTTGATGIGTATGLPAGVTAAWASNTITISGTPTAAGTFNYTIPLTGGCGTANATGTIIVNINTVSSTTTRTLCINTALSPTIARTTTGATGIGTATGLPAGVTAAWASNTITISGTPTAAGTFNYTIPLTGGCGTVNATGTIIVTPNNTVTSNAARTLCINTALSPAITHTTTGATGIGTATGLPAGVTAAWASNTITISGTPTAAGTFNYTIPLTGSCGVVNATGTIIVTPNNTVTSNAARTLCINTALSPAITHTTTGATGIGTATGLPAGVTATWAANTITISGTPTAAGTFNYTIPLSGGCGTVNATGTIIVTPNNTVTSNAARTLCINSALSPAITHTTTGATGIGTATGLPAGVTATWAANTITISGTPTAAGTYNYTIPLTGGCGTVNATGQIIVNINTAATVANTTLCIGTTISRTQATTGATGIGTATGLPAGVTVSWAANVITFSGTPTAAGTFAYTIPLTGGCGVVNATGTIIVTPNNTVTSNAARTLCINTALSPAITHTTTGATGIGTATGLPAGVTAAWASNTITISGTPTAAGTFNYTIPLTGGCGVVNATGTIIVTPNRTVTSNAARTLCINTALSPAITHTTTGATGIGTATGLPAGVTAAWAANTITISGTPTAAGTFNYTIPLSGGCGTVNATGTIIVTPNNTVTSNAARTLCINTALSPAITHTTTGATGIGTATGLPAGVTASWASNTITISGTPTAAGTFNYTIPLTGGCGTVNATGQIIVNINTAATVANTTLCIGTTISRTQATTELQVSVQLPVYRQV
ncbi:MAG: carbohydrate binding domain-containing protein [Saprospiraceae bacterium]|nr:carbohydrate binding domain-containing protein [Saprospiraceae bacterium]